jgi:flagellar basal-body rod protein FlgF
LLLIFQAFLLAQGLQEVRRDVPSEGAAAMDNVMYVGLSRQQTLQHEIDVIANNVANVDTTGFKLESLIVQSRPETLPSGGSGPSTVNFAYDAGVVRDFRQGSLKQTGAPLDVAVEGEGFFKVQGPSGERYTRDGRFSMDASGRLVGESGLPVQGDGGDIVLDPTKGAPKVGEDGTISQAGEVVGKIALVNFASLSALSKDGDGLYRNDSNLQPQAATSARVRQGMVEGSNVEPITQITRLIQVSRAYESIAKMVDQTGDLSARSIDRLGRIT